MLQFRPQPFLAFAVFHTHEIIGHRLIRHIVFDMKKAAAGVYLDVNDSRFIIDFDQLAAPVRINDAMGGEGESIPSKLHDGVGASLNDHQASSVAQFRLDHDAFGTLLQFHRDRRPTDPALRQEGLPTRIAHADGDEKSIEAASNAVHLTTELQEDGSGVSHPGIDAVFGLHGRVIALKYALI